MELTDTMAEAATPFIYLLTAETGRKHVCRWIFCIHPSIHPFIYLFDCIYVYISG